MRKAINSAYSATASTKAKPSIVNGNTVGRAAGLRATDADAAEADNGKPRADQFRGFNVHEPSSSKLHEIQRLELTRRLSADAAHR